MKKFYDYLLMASFIVWGLQVSAQKKYVDEVFVDADIEVTYNIKYATNIDFLISKFVNPTQIGMDLTVIKTAVATGQPIPTTYYNPFDTTTHVKVTDLKMDVYAPKASSDTTTARPVIIYLHTGNFLPPGINGSPLGYRTDSTAQILCRQWAKRGYVAISASYRLGWNPLAQTVQERRGQLLNAVYRAIHDVQRCVMSIRMEAGGSNTFRVDSTKIALFGEGTGAYISLAYVTMDKFEELELPKFINPVTAKSYIDVATVGKLDGSGGALNLYGAPKTDLSVVAAVAAGGALADTSWLEEGDAAMISIQCIRDPFAPFDEGIVIVPVTGEDVVEVQGANLYIEKANAVGNNDAFKNMPNDDVLTSIARAKYGKTYDYIYPSPRDKVTLKASLEGLYAVDIAAGASLFQNEAQPWQWWDPQSPAALAVVDKGPPPITAHMASLRSNPNMSPAKGRAYADTIQGYVCPRLAIVMGYYTTNDFVGVNEVTTVNARIYPNPSTGMFTIAYDGQGSINEIYVRDFNGRTVGYSNNLGERTATVDLSNLSSGHYVLHILTDEGTAVQKVQLTK